MFHPGALHTHTHTLKISGFDHVSSETLSREILQLSVADRVCLKLKNTHTHTHDWSHNDSSALTDRGKHTHTHTASTSGGKSLIPSVVFLTLLMALLGFSGQNNKVYTNHPVIRSR